METEYKIKVWRDGRDISGTLLNYEDKTRLFSYEDSKSRIISNKPTSDEDFEVIEICRDLAELLDSEEMEITVKSK